MDTARLLLLWAALTSAVATEIRYFAIGGDLRLELEPPPSNIERVVWKHNVNLLADVTLGKFNSYGPFKGYATLEENGSLRIKNIQSFHAGIYSVEVNNKIQDQQYDVRMINKVSQPIVRATPVSCSYTSESCVLVCEVNVTGAGPVSYGWFIEKEKSEETSYKLTIEPRPDPPSTYTCQVTNPVSEKDSEPLENPLIPPPSPSPSPSPYLAFILLPIALCVAGVAYWKREAIKSMWCKSGVEGQRNNSNNNPADTTESRTETQALRKSEPESPTAEKTAPHDGDDRNTPV